MDGKGRAGYSIAAVQLTAMIRHMAGIVRDIHEAANQVQRRSGVGRGGQSLVGWTE